MRKEKHPQAGSMSTAVNSPKKLVNPEVLQADRQNEHAKRNRVGQAKASEPN
jgi:hypothetical protein